MTDKTTKSTLTIIFTIFGIFLIGAVAFYLMNIGILPDFRNDRVDSDGHHKELAIPENLREDIATLEGSIEELVQSGQVGQEVKLQSSDFDEQIDIDDQNQFEDDIKKIENRFEDLQKVVADEEKNSEQVDLVEEIADEIEGPDNVFEFNPL